MMTVFCIMFFLTISFNRIHEINSIDQSLRFAFLEPVTLQTNHSRYTLSFTEINNPEKMWDWLHNRLTPLIFILKNDNNDPFSNINAPTISIYNELSQKVLLKQLRVIKDGCSKSEETSISSSCWGEINNKNKDTEMPPQFEECPLSEDCRPLGWGTIEYDGTTLTTNYDSTYNNYFPGLWSSHVTGGYALEIPEYCGTSYITFDERPTKCPILDQLERSYWVDRHTRVVTLDMTYKNINLDINSYVRAAFEFEASGYIRPSLVISSFRLNPYGQNSKKQHRHRILITLEVFTIFGLVVMSYRLLEVRWARFDNWVYLGFLLLLWFQAGMTIVLRYLIYIKTNQQTDEFYDFSRIALMNRVILDFTAINSVTCVLLLSRLLTFSTRLSRFYDGIAAVSRQLLPYFPIGCLVIESAIIGIIFKQQFRFYCLSE
eukprot:GHVL01037328.1.p1 GENE.GHVL01037328.1~~GHVL01037328.1.p1  ORF type:complete len:440 (-),score=45.30 GHVL01037328.1:763-2058(-)